MNPSITVTLITVSGSIILAAITFYLTKKHQISSEWQNQKLNNYKGLLSSLSDIAVDGRDKNDAHMKFALAANTIALVAPQSVISALMEYHTYAKFSNKSQTVEEHDRLLKRLLLEIRKDIGLATKDNPTTFNFHLIGSAPKK
jgi:hypothetical protein